MLVLAAFGLCVISPQAMAASKKKKKKKTEYNTTEPQGGGYHGGKYHLRKEGEAKKPLLRWDGFNNPVDEIKDSAKKPPSKLPSQSTDK